MSIATDSNKRFTIESRTHSSSDKPYYFLRDGDKFLLRGTHNMLSLAMVHNLLNEMHETIKRYEDAHSKEEV